jgi:hypothetical protein
MLAALTALVAARRAAPGRTELELRLGRHDGERFAPGVPRGVFEQLEADLEAAPQLEADEGWAETVDYHYATARGERARTRVGFDTRTMQTTTEHVVKERAESAVLRRADGHEACRVACAVEAPLADPPTTCVPTFVRVKQRRSFRDRREGGAVVWRYDLSRTWAAPSRTAVEHAQLMAPPTYEIECELVDEKGAYLAARTDAQVAASLRLKAALLLGEAADGDDLLLLAREVRVPAAHKRKRRGGSSSP